LIFFALAAAKKGHQTKGQQQFEPEKKLPFIPFCGKLANSNPIIYEYNLIIRKVFVLKKFATFLKDYLKNL
jgi:hypothetical protein